ncbi:unnamed protein product [Citrullus colocynthis]|uniref:Malic enzyme NAD-binding domain-containing protein n=1 Tax=Citrullus colocynthis TaxID=252529 RepID=A0ABP0YA93_9ROSI
MYDLVTFKESLQHLKQPWAHEHEPIKDLVGVVKDIKPTVLIGTSGVGRTFTKEVVEAIVAINEKPIIVALLNPTSQSECTAEEAYTWTKGRAIFASSSPFDPVEYKVNVFVPKLANKAYIFLGFRLGLIMFGTIRIRDDMLLAASWPLHGGIGWVKHEITRSSTEAKHGGIEMKKCAQQLLATQALMSKLANKIM